MGKLHPFPSKAPSASGKAEQKEGKKVFRGEAKHSWITPRRSARRPWRCSEYAAWKPWPWSEKRTAVLGARSAIVPLLQKERADCHARGPSSTSRQVKMECRGWPHGPAEPAEPSCGIVDTAVAVAVLYCCYGHVHVARCEGGTIGLRESCGRTVKQAQTPTWSGKHPRQHVRRF